MGISGSKDYGSDLSDDKKKILELEELCPASGDNDETTSKKTTDPSYRTLQNEEDAPQPLNVIILGGHKVGKSAVGNAILGRKAFNFWSFFFNECVEKQGNVNGRSIKVVHATGWTGFDHTTLEYNKGEIATSVFRCPEGHVACVLVVSIDSDVTEKDRKAAEQHMELIGGSVWEHTVLVITGKSDKSNLSETDIMNTHKWLREKCGNRCHWLDKDNVNDLIKKLVGAATWYNGHDNCFKANNSAFSQESQMDSQCPEERTETENGGLQQENIKPPQQATTQESHHELSSACENTSGLLRKVYNIHRPYGPDSQQVQENKKLLERWHSMFIAIEFQKQKMAEFCSFLISLTKTTGPIDENLKDFKHQSAPFVNENMEELIERAVILMKIANSLLAEKIIETEQYDEIKMAGTNPEKMILICRALSPEAKKTSFLELLMQKDGCLFQDLAFLVKKKLQELELQEVADRRGLAGV